MPRGHPLLDFMVPGLTDLMPTRHSVARSTRQNLTFHLSHHIILAYGAGHKYIQVMSISFREKKRILMPWKLNLLWICPQCLYQSTTGVFKMALQHSKFLVAYMRYFSWEISEMSASSSAKTSFSAKSSTEMPYVCHQALWVLQCSFKGYQDTRISIRQWHKNVHWNLSWWWSNHSKRIQRNSYKSNEK